MVKGVVTCEWITLLKIGLQHEIDLKGKEEGGWKSAKGDRKNK